MPETEIDQTEHTPLTCPSICPACPFCTREAQAECSDPACHVPALTPDECRHCGRPITRHEGIGGVQWRDDSKHLSAGCPGSRSHAHESVNPPGGRCLRCGAKASYDPQGRRWVHEDPAVSMAVDHAAYAPRPTDPA